MKKIELKLKKISFFVIGLISFIGCTYLILFLLIFDNKIQCRNYKVYSDHAIPENIHSILDSVDQKLKVSEILSSTLKHKIYICSNHQIFGIFNPQAKQVFGISNPLNIFITKSDIENNMVYRNGLTNNKRTLTSVITHEIVHHFIWEKTGFVRSLALPNWKVEGYCDFIAQESSFDYHEGVSLIVNHKKTSNPSFLYFVGRLSIEYLIVEKQKKYSEIINENIQLESVLNEMIDSRYLTNETKQLNTLPLQK